MRGHRLQTRPSIICNKEPSVVAKQSPTTSPYVAPFSIHCVINWDQGFIAIRELLVFGVDAREGTGSVEARTARWTIVWRNPPYNVRLTHCGCGEERPPSSRVCRDRWAYQARYEDGLRVRKPRHMIAKCGSRRTHGFQVLMSRQSPAPELLADLFYYPPTDVRGH